MLICTKWRSLTLLAFISAGCASYEAHPIDPKQTDGAFRARSLTDADLALFIGKNRATTVPTTPGSAWDLSSLTLAAYYFHPDLDVARAKMMEASAGVRTAGQLPNPTLVIDPERSINPDGVSPWVLGANLDIPIE